MAGFGYQDPLKGKKFDFGTAFGSSTTLNQDPSRGLTGQDAYFDTQNVYGGDRMARDRAVGRMAAGQMGATLTDRQLQNLGSGLSAFRDLVNLRTTLNGGVGSANYASALQDPSVQSWMDSGDLLGATGFGGQDGGSAFGTLEANAQAAHDAGDQTMYRAFTSPTNFYQLADLGSRTMGGVGAQLFGQGMDDAVSAYNLGQDPFNAAGSDVFGQGQMATYTNQPVIPEQEQPQEQPQAEENAPSPQLDPQPEGGLVGNTGGSAFGSAGGPMPDTGMGLDDLNKRIAALEGAFFEAQGVKPDSVQLNHLTKIANSQGLDAAVQYAKNNIVVQAIKASGRPAPKIQSGADVNGASAFYDFIMQWVPGAITQPKDEYVRNILALYANNGM